MEPVEWFFLGEEKKRLGRERKGRYIGGRMKIRSLGEPERWHVIWCYEVKGDAGLILFVFAVERSGGQKEKKKRFCK